MKMVPYLYRIKKMEKSGFVKKEQKSYRKRFYSERDITSESCEAGRMKFSNAKFKCLFEKQMYRSGIYQIKICKISRFVAVGKT